jgi:hypothetical protein
LLQVKSLEAQLSQLKSQASYYQQLSQESQASLDEARQALAEAEEALADARRQAKAAAAAAAASANQQHQQGVAAAAGRGHGHAVMGGAPGQQQQQQLQQRCELLEMQLGKLQEEQRTYRSTTEAMMEAKDNELLAALRKNATLTEELSQLRLQQQQQQPVRLLGSPSVAAASARGSGADVMFSAVSAGVTGAAGGDEGSGFDASSVTGSMMQSRQGGVVGSQQLLGSYVASEPGEKGLIRLH